MQTASPPGWSRRIIWIVVVLIVVAVLGAGAYNAVALPGCSSCHGRQPGFLAATAASPHAQVACRACHVPSGWIDRFAFGLRQPFHMFVPVVRGPARDAAAVPDSRCLACHRKIESTVVVANGIRIAHGTCSVGATCSDCHSTTAHGKATPWVRTYDMERCLECHVTKEQTACDLCHEGRRTTDRVNTGAFALTHGPQWRKTHGMGNPATCTVCHQSDDCARCHGDGVPHEPKFIDTHAEVSQRKNAKCGGCHAPTFCSTCHGIAMPHPAQFTREHAKAAKSKPLLCKRCHAGADCTGCHVKHIHPGGAAGGFQGGGGS